MQGIQKLTYVNIGEINALIMDMAVSGSMLDILWLRLQIGNINCCAPTCADDVALISNNPLELQTMIDIVVYFSKREGYLLQPTKLYISQH
jgi:hypothetical protein